MSTIVELQQIVADETRSTEERKQAAELILAMQGETEVAAQEEHRTERRAQFPGAQQRLATNLSLGNPAFNLIESKSGVRATVDKLAVAQVIRLMLDEDGNDGILYAAMGWNSESRQSLADRMGNHQSQNECNPAYRLGMQSREKQVTYAKHEAGFMRLPYTEPVPERRLEDATRMSSQEFAEFSVNFHRKVLTWDLKEFIYNNLKVPGTEFFPRFIALQKESDGQEETVFKNAYAAHLRALDPGLGEEEAEDFLNMLADMRGRENLEAERRAKRIEDRQKLAAPAPQPPALEELPAEKSGITSEQVAAAIKLCDLQLEKLNAAERISLGP